MPRILLIALLVFAPVASHAFDRVSDEGTFLGLVSEKSLTNRLYGITLNVSPAGTIVGDALGWDITGDWVWENGFFCRDMAWGGDPIEYNCQVVEAKGDEVRFISDQGTGDSASFRLR